MNGNHFDIHDLKREYEKGRKQGAVEELEQLWNFIQNQPLNITGNNFEKNWFSIKKKVDKRLLELKGEQK